MATLSKKPPVGSPDKLFETAKREAYGQHITAAGELIIKKRLSE